ncbi:MAG: DUF2089 family protein [Candidatus Latescibacteria bacterium]|nr:DUF2089 family protein [Candidatus Latescibacterota bacterium]
MRCSSCELTLEGHLPISRLALLSNDHQQFIEAFLLARGNIKEVEKELGISYPTVRKRLDEVIGALGHISPAQQRQQHEILDAMERGELDPQEGLALIKALRKPQ